MTAEIPFQGISASPADRLNQDGALSLAYNLAPDDTAGGLAPIGTPTIIATLPDGATLRYIHKGASYTHWIITTDAATYWCEEGETNPTLDDTHLIANANPTDISAVGNMLILAHGHATPVTYHLWRDAQYEALGSCIPSPRISFSLTTGAEDDKQLIPYQADIAFNHGYGPLIIDSAPYPNPLGGNDIDVKPVGYPLSRMYTSSEYADDIPVLRNAIWGRINQKIAQDIWGEGRFCHPFLVCYALRLFDGSYAAQSAPMLMNTEPISHALFYPIDGSTDNSLHVIALNNINSYALHMRVDAIFDKYAWRDLIVAIDIFISQPFYGYDSSDAASAKFTFIQDPINEFLSIYSNGTINFPSKDIDKQINDCSTFYLVKSIDINDLPTDHYWHTVDIEQGEHLANLVTHKAMPYGFHSRDSFAATGLTNYNHRLHITDPKTFLFSGFRPEEMIAPLDYLSPSGSSLSTGRCLVTLENPSYGKAYAFTNSMTAIQPIASQSNPSASSAQVTRPLFFYYPNSSARLMQIDFGSWRYDIPLKPHAFLPGSYAYYPVGSQISQRQVAIPAQAYQLAESNNILQPSTVFVSEVDNPMVFSASSTVTIGASRIRAIATAARPLSQGQFGQFPLYVFTDEGIWAMEISADGRYTARQPITRDVALSPHSIASIDSAVVFASHRGLMLLSGSETTCISDVLNTNAAPFSIASLPGLSTVAPPAAPATLHPLRQFLTGCRIAYDYSRQRLIIFNPDIQYAYVYSLRTRRWGMTASTLQSLVNSYPQALAIDSAHHVVDLSVDAAYPPQLLVTRPLSVDGTDGFATIDAVICRGDFSRGDVATILYGSRDLHHWHLVRSSVDHILRGFSGSPYRYYRLALPCTLTAEDTIHAASLSYNPRLRNQLR